MEESTRLLWKDKLHPEIYNCALPIDQKLFLQRRLEELGGEFDKLLEDIEKYAILPEVEDYEKAALIRDYRADLHCEYSGLASVKAYDDTIK